MKTQMNLLIVALLFGSSLCPDLRANDWPTCNGQKLRWNGTHLSLRASQIGFPQGSVWGQILQNSIDSWNDTPTAFSYGLTYGDTNVAVGNSQNEVYWEHVVDANPAWCVVVFNPANCRIVETDVVVNSHGTPWTPSYLKSDLQEYGGPDRQLFGTLIHEVGHAQGLGHTADTYAIMGGGPHSHANGILARAYPGEDAVSESMTVYGQTSAAFEDLAVAHWRQTGSNGGYSTHERCRLFDGNGAELPKARIWPEPSYRVDAGQTVQLEMSYENLGRSFKGTRVGFYISGNDYISTYDTLIGSRQLYLAVDTVYTTSSWVTIPTSLVPGQSYWLGALTDYDSQLAESDEFNNSAYIEIRINVPLPDLRAAGIQGPPGREAAWPGKQLTVQREIQSVGAPHTGSFAYELRLSVNTTITTSDPLVLAASSSTFGSADHEVTIPADLPPGNYHWGLIVSPVSGETELSNNTLAGGTIEITAVPDLVALSVRGPKRLKRGRTYTVTFDADRLNYTGSFSYEIRLSKNRTIDESDILLTSGQSALSGPQPVTFQMPRVRKGRYHWGLIVRPLSGESALLNNAVAGKKVRVKK